VIIQGDCSSLVGANTILDGGEQDGTATANPLTQGNLDLTTNVTLKCITVQNYGGGHASGAGFGDCGSPANENWCAQIATYDGWLITRSTLASSGGWGAQICGAGSITNSLVANNYHGGINAQGCGLVPGTTTSGAGQYMQGNEISNNNLRGDSIYDDAGGTKNEANQPLFIRYNYVHDNQANGIWCDIHCDNAQIVGNTVLNNAGQGIRYEISTNGAISHNVLSGNAQAAIACSNSQNCMIFSNNISVPAVSGSAGLDVDAACRSDSPSPNGSQVYGNVVTFASPGVGPPYAANSSGINGLYDNTGGSWGANACPAGQPYVASLTSNLFTNNVYYSPAITDLHWLWGSNDTWCALDQLQNGQCSSGSAFYAIPAGKVETGSTIQVGNGSVPGCAQIGCTSSGI
jgi:parallel beta-helix repeat protein